MIQAPNLPPWAGVLVAILLVAGALVALIGSIGLLRLRTFYDRVHAPTMGSSMGVGLVALASMVCFSALEGRPSVHELLIVVFVTLTTPVTFMLLGRAALYRDRSEGSDVPPAR